MSLLLPLVLACASPGTPVSVPFDVVAAGHPLRCGVPVAVDSHQIELRDLRLFVHDVQLVGADGVAHRLVLDEGPWQHDGTALLDFEDGCHNGSTATNTQLVGSTAAAAPYRAVRFTVGVPTATNHADPLTLEPPLTTMAMHWGWQAGFKFVRFDYRYDGHPVRMHLGSTGCEGPMGAVTGCARANRATVEVPFVGDDASVQLDLGPALATTGAGEGCMADPDDPGCTPWFAHFGVDGRTGQAMASARAFGAR